MTPSSSPTTSRLRSRRPATAGAGSGASGPVGVIRALALVVELAVALALAACVPAPGTEAPAPRPELPLRTVEGAAHYRVVDKETRVYARVFRGGAMAKLGHNHVVAFPGVRGDMYLAAAPRDSVFDLVVGVADAVVDPPDLRRSQERSFQTEISNQDRSRTRRNMLSAQVLDAARHPYVVISSAAIEGPFEEPRVTVDLTIRGTTRRFTLPVSVRRGKGMLTAKGRLGIVQSDFGIEPYEVLGGALRVKDRVELVFEVTAQRVP